MLLLPKRRPVWVALGGFVLATLPIHLALYLVPWGNQWWWVGPVFTVTLVISIAAVLYRFYRVHIRIEDGVVSGHVLMSGPFRYRVSEVSTIVLFRLRHAHESVPRVQAYPLDAEGNPLGRLRVTFWRPEDVNAFIAAIGVSVTQVDRLVSIEELQRNYSHLLYWFERSPYAATSQRRRPISVAASQRSPLQPH